jgi:hypothetical protein
MYVFEIDEHSKNFKKPNDNNNDNNYVEDVFNLMVHWDIIIDKPEQQASNNKYD